MPLIKLMIVTALLLTVVSCSRIITPDDEVVSARERIQCVRYFIYEMCVKDVTQDDSVDFIYFTDTREAFMRSETFSEEQIKALGYPLHQCIQILNQKTQLASNNFLAIDENTPSSEASKIKSRLFKNYSSYAATIKACNKQHGRDVAYPDEDSDDFGEQSFDDF